MKILQYKQQNQIPKNIGHFTITEEIGCGGMGKVYKAYDQKLNRFVALKVLLENIKTKQKERFIREAKAIAKLNHPNIVKIHYIDELEAYFTMDLIEGVSLKDYLEQTSLDIRFFARLMVKIAQTISFAHSQGIIHRDLKPSNIMLDKSCKPYVMDFGLAKLAFAEKSITKKGDFLGTPAYMSPEQARGEKVDYLSDVYSLGVCFYEMLTFKPLVTEGNIADILHQIVHKTPTPLREHNPQISRELQTICHKALAKEANKRYQSAKEFAEDLERFLDGKLILAIAPSFYERTKQKIREHKVSIVASMIAFLLLVLGIFLAQFYHYKKIDSKTVIYLQKSQKLLKNPSLVNCVSAENALNKALELAPKNQKIKTLLLQTQELLAKQALKKQEYFLVQIAIRKIRKLGSLKKADVFYRQMLKQQQISIKKHKVFIKKAMQNMAQNFASIVLDNYVFRIIKINKPFVVKALVPYLESENRVQRTLAIRTLGRLNNTHTKVQGRDSVQWLMQLLKEHHSVFSQEQEVEELINALGWLKDARANVLIDQVRNQIGENSVLWKRTKIAYSRIPIKKVAIKNSIDYLNRGRVKYNKGDFSGAVIDCTRAIKLNSMHPSSFLTRGNAYQAMGNLKAALADFTQALMLDPEYIESYLNRGNVHRLLGFYKKAIYDFTRVLKLKPQCAPAYHHRGVVYYKMKNFNNAIYNYNKALKLSPTYVDVYNNRGIAYEYTGNLAKALKDYSKALKLNPHFPDAYLNRGNVFKKLQYYKQAMDDYRQALNLNPRLLEAYLNRGLIYQDKGNFKKALADFDQVISFNPKYANAYYGKANVYQHQKLLHKALEHYNKAIFLDPKHADAYLNRGNVYQSLGNLRKAIVDYDQSIRLEPKRPDTYVTLGIAYARLQNHKQAFKNFQIFLKLAPNHSSAPRIRAIMQQYYRK